MSDTVEAMQWIRQDRLREQAADPVHYYRCGKESYILEAHESEIARLNEARMPAYLAAERRRVAAHEAWRKRTEQAIREDRFLRAPAATVAAEEEIPIDKNSRSSAEALKRRKERPPIVQPPMPPLILEPEPPSQPFEDAEFLWTRAYPPFLDSDPIVRIEGTKRYEHD